VHIPAVTHPPINIRRHFQCTSALITYNYKYLNNYVHLICDICNPAASGLGTPIRRGDICSENSFILFFYFFILLLLLLHLLPLFHLLPLLLLLFLLVFIVFIAFIASIDFPPFFVCISLFLNFII
jgi:hypothetical protein